MEETKEYKRHNISEGRRDELAVKIDEIFERYERTFGVAISNGEIIAIIEEGFRDVQKAWVRKILGPITYTDRDYLVRLFKTRQFEKELDEQESQREGQKEPAQKSRTKGAGASKKKQAPRQASSNHGEAQV